MYQTSLNIEDAIQEQRVYTLQQFFEVMIDHKYKKSLVLQDGLPMGLMFGTTSLEKMRLNGVNPDALGRRFPEATSQKRLFYLMVIYFSPELRSFGFYNWYLPLVVFPIADLCDVFVADFCDARSSLIVVLEACIKEAGVPVGPRQRFGNQTYGGFIREGS